MISNAISREIGGRADTNVGVVGLGAMGSRIARRLLEAGLDVTVWNRTPSKADSLGKAGARVAKTPGEIAQNCAVVISMVSDPDALRDVAMTPTGIVSNLAPSSVWLEMSTIGPAAIWELSRMLDDDSRLLESPVLGSLSEAEQGSLTLFVSGSQPLVEDLRPLLSVLGTPLYVGTRGAAASAKLVANLTLVGTIGMLGETIALAEALSLPIDVVFKVLSSTPLAEQAERRKKSITTGEYPRRFPLALARKDAQLIQRSATDLGVVLPLAEAASRWLDEAVSAGLGESDYSAMLGYILSQTTGGTRETSDESPVIPTDPLET